MFLKIIPALVLFTAVSAQARTITCTEIYDVRSEVLQTRYSLTVTEIADITDKVPYGDKYDSVSKVKVDVTATLGNQKKKTSFQAVATSEDVIYLVKEKTRGFNLRVYLDEPEASSMTMMIERGIVDVDMKCDEQI